jgi:multicomponent Na+:H+ antiporter subunit G
MTLLEITVTIMLIIGTIVMILGSVGVVRFGDVFLRMHAATKSSTLGIGFIMVGVAFYFADPLITIKLAALTVIYFFTSPIGAQVLAHAAHVARVPLVQETWIDDLASSHYTDIEPEHHRH